MEEYNYNNDNNNDYNTGYENQSSNKSVRGYQIVIILLVVVLGVLALIYFRQVGNLKQEYAVEKELLTTNINSLIEEIDNTKIENDSITYSLGVERDKADSLLTQLQKERNMNRQTIRKYEEELNTMRDIMRRYVHQIDSLNQLNRALAQENVNIRKQATSDRLRAQAAEERVGELDKMVQAGSVIRARNVTLTALNSADRVVPRANRAERLRVDFTLSANELARPGQRYVYVRITGPDGYVLAGDTSSLFDFEGDKITYSAAREIDYQNLDLSVGLFYNGSGIDAGTYTVEVYMDGYKVGQGETLLK